MTPSVFFSNQVARVIQRQRGLSLILLGILALSGSFSGAVGMALASDTAPTAPTSKTHLVVKLATHESLPVRSQFIEQPPTIILQFPEGRVSGVLPEHSLVKRGVIREIHTSYAETPPGESRWIQALYIYLRGPYPYTVQTEPGRIIVDIEHPVDLAREAVDVGVAGSSVVVGTTPQIVSERFQAMQDALVRVRQPAWTWNAPKGQRERSPHSTAPLRASTSSSTNQALLIGATRGVSSAPPPRISPTRKAASRTRAWWWLGGLLGFAVGSVLWLSARGRLRRGLRRQPAERSLQDSAVFRLMDQLVWQALERQGYQLLHTIDGDGSLGPLRIVVKDGLKAALLCVGEGTFFEKSIVEQFLLSMRMAQVEQGILVAPGSFTVPAQRLAKDHGITLIGREQLTELFSEGAMSEYYTKHVQQLHRQLEDTKETLNQYAQQLDVIRRQRNEASWFLGEERATSAKLEEQIAELSQQLLHSQAQADERERAVEAIRKQWEEDQWHLGEAKATIAHLEDQRRTLQETHAQLEERLREASGKLQETERAREEANWYLGELREQHRQLCGQLAEAQAALPQARQEFEEQSRRLEAERARRKLFESEVAAMRTFGERRRAARLYPAEAAVELQDITGVTLFQGRPRDVSQSGMGIDAPQPLNLPEILQVRLQLPGLERPVESTGRVVWQGSDAPPQRYRGGCQLCDLTSDSREAFERALAQLQAAGNGTS